VAKGIHPEWAKDGGAANTLHGLNFWNRVLQPNPMTIAEQIFQHLAALSAKEQREVLDFVEFLESRHCKQSQRSEDESWSTFSLESAMQGIEDDPIEYTAADLKETF